MTGGRIPLIRKETKVVEMHPHELFYFGLIPHVHVVAGTGDWAEQMAN